MYHITFFDGIHLSMQWWFWQHVDHFFLVISNIFLHDMSYLCNNCTFPCCHKKKVSKIFDVTLLYLRYLVAKNLTEKCFPSNAKQTFSKFKNIFGLLCKDNYQLLQLLHNIMYCQFAICYPSCFMLTVYHSSKCWHKVLLAEHFKAVT